MVAEMFDDRLLGPGWGGDVSDDEVGFIQEELLRDKKLAYQWGFAPSRRTRPADAIRRVALEGDPNHRNANVSLTRPNSRLESRTTIQPLSQPTDSPCAPPEAQPATPPEKLTLWAYAGIDDPSSSLPSELTEVGG